MYFLLKNKPIGALYIYSDGICRFLQKVLEQHSLGTVSCRSFYISDDDGNGMLVLNERNTEAERMIESFMNVIGIKTKIICEYDGAADINLAYKAGLSMRSPWFWCSLTAVIALVFFVGLPGLFWLSFWGSVGWFSSKFIMLLRASSWISSRRPPIDKS
jgi:hypothetical protein